MIDVRLHLSMGHFDEGHMFQEWDNVDLEVYNPDDDVDCDNLNDWLNTHADPICTYAELRVKSSVLKHNGFLIGSFRKTTVKRHGSSETRWVLTA